MSVKKSENITTKKTVTAALFLAIGWLLPFLTGQIRTIGQMLLPMHLPVMISGFVLGPVWGLVLGFVTPITRSLIFGMPVLYPMAAGMAFELAAYGFFCGFLYERPVLSIKADRTRIYASLVVSMLTGRAVWGIARLVMFGAVQTPITWKIFFVTEFAKAWPGMIIQLIIIPPVVRALRKVLYL